jgi:hypothetical protein
MNAVEAKIKLQKSRVVPPLAAGCLLFLAACQTISTGIKDVPAAPKPDALEKSVEKGPVKLTVRLAPLAPRLSDTLSLEITIKAAKDVEVHPPVFGQGVGDFLVRDYAEKNPSVEGDSTIRHIRYTLEPAHGGKHLIRSVSAEFIDRRPDSESKDKTVQVETEPLEVFVSSELGNKIPNLADLASMNAPLAFPPRIGWLGLSAAILVVLLAVAGLLWWRFHKRRQLLAERKLTPEEAAAEALKKLLAENLHGRAQYKEFYVRLTGLVRRYIESTTGIHAPEQTTEEFLRDIRARPVFPAERAARLTEFLQAADMVKYAAQEPGQRQIEDAISRAQEFVGLPSAFRPMETAA